MTQFLISDLGHFFQANSLKLRPDFGQVWFFEHPDFRYPLKLYFLQLIVLICARPLARFLLRQTRLEWAST